MLSGINYNGISVVEHLDYAQTNLNNGTTLLPVELEPVDPRDIENSIVTGNKSSKN
jgi:hypothetical protein